MAFANAVALRKESVDRNIGENIKRRLQHVALRKESVDRNYKGAQIWTYWQVALRKESVDRNILHGYLSNGQHSRSPQGERG